MHNALVITGVVAPTAGIAIACCLRVTVIVIQQSWRARHCYDAGVVKHNTRNAYSLFVNLRSDADPFPLLR